MRPLILFALISNGSAAVKMPSIFSDHMVLQRDKPVPIWGQADSGEEVTVEFANQKKTTQANAAGRWNLTLDPMPANAEPQLLKIGALRTFPWDLNQASERSSVPMKNRIRVR